jgi:hypothetical protein
MGRFVGRGFVENKITGIKKQWKTVGFTAMTVAFIVLPIAVIFITANPFESGSVEGEVVGGGPLVGDFSLRIDKCRSGMPDGFSGIYLGASDRSDARIKLFDDQIGGKKVVLQVPGSCEGPRCKHMVLCNENCTQFGVRWDKTDTSINKVRVLEGEMAIDCILASGDWVRGRLKFAGCH